MSDTITRRAQELEEFTNMLKWNNWHSHSGSAHSTYWEPPLEKGTMSLGWSQINVPAETHHEFEFLLRCAKERFDEWYDLGYNTDSIREAVERVLAKTNEDEDDAELILTDVREHVKRYLGTKGCVLWGQHWNLVDDRDRAADWLIKEVDGLMNYLMDHM